MPRPFATTTTDARHLVRLPRLRTAGTGAAAVLAAALAGGCADFVGLPAPPAPAVDVGVLDDDQQAVLADAEIAKNAGDYDVALDLFQQILAENPTITTAYLGVGGIHLDRGDYAEAEPAFRQAAILEPRNFGAQFGHGLSLQLLGRFVEAVQAYQRALVIDPDDFGANRNIASTYLRLEQAERALRFAERAVELDPDSGPAWTTLGAAYETVDRDPEAIDAWLQAIELMGNEPPLVTNLVNALARERRYAEAANTARLLVRIDPSPNAYERLGWCLFKLREYGESLEAYREAVALDPGHWPSQNGIGVNLLNEWLLGGRTDAELRIAARDAFRRSLRANREQPRVVQLMLNYEL